MGKKRAVPIVSSAYADDCAKWTIQDLANWLPVAAEGPGTRSNEIAITPPGLQEYATVPDATRQRGGYVAEGRLFAVVDTTLYQVMPDGSLRTKGTIPGRGRCSFAHNGVTELLIVNGSAGYIYDWTLDTLTQITDAGFPGAILAAYISNLFLIVEPSRRYAQNSALNDGLNWNALETYQGESKPDLIVGHIVANGEYVLFGERSTDHFQYTGETNALFQNKLISIDRGAASAHAISLLDEAVFLVGNDGSGYEKRGYSFKRITTHAIEQAWSEHDLSKAFSFVWEDKGHKVWYVTFPDGGHTWGFDLATRKWHRRQSAGMNRWRLAWLQPWNGAWYGGEYNSGRIFRLDWDYHLEGADRITRLCISGVAHDNQNRLTLNEFEPVVEAVGEATTATSVFSLIFDDTQEEVEGLTIGGGLPDGAVGDAVNFQYATIGGVAPISFSVTSGVMPAGMSLDAATGAVTGTYTTAEHDNAWTVTATDALGATATLAETQYVMDMTGDFPDASAGAYSHGLTGTEGTAPYTFAQAGGTLPGGCTLSSAGLLSGTATESSVAFSVTMTDAAGVTQTKNYTVVIGAALTFDDILLSYNPIAWWKLDESAGSTATDYVGSNDGTYAGVHTLDHTNLRVDGGNAPLFTAWPAGGGGDAGRVHVLPDTLNSLDMAIGDPYTIYAVFKQTVEYGDTGASNSALLMHLANNVTTGKMNIQFFVSQVGTAYKLSAYCTKYPSGSTAVTDSSALTKNGIYFGAMVYDGVDEFSLNINGTTVATQTDATPSTPVWGTDSSATLGGLNIGSPPLPNTPGNGFTGNICDVAIFRTALSDAQLLALYNAGHL